MTKSQTIANDVVALLRARNPLLWIVTREESRVERYIYEAATAAGYVPAFWDVAAAVTNLNGDRQSYGENDCVATLTTIMDRANGVGSTRTAWIMRDLPAWLDGLGGALARRQLRNLCRRLPMVGRDTAQAIIVITPSSQVPEDLAAHATVIEWPLPDREEIAAILDASISVLPETDKDGNAIRANAAPNGTRESAIDAAVGLTGEEAQGCYAKSLVQTRTINPLVVASEKKRVIARERVLEWYDPIPGGLDAVGGLELLKGWLVSRKDAYSKAARDYGLPAPKGALLVGVPGCGKSLTAKAISTAWGVPLLRLDVGALRSKFVGESEANIRKAFRVIEAIGRSVVWLDEIEKALASSGAAADGGVSSDALGAILNWMQERQGESFVIATANDVTALPPELMRKGRFDDVWFVDLPTQRERVEILKASLKQYNRAAFSDVIDIAMVADVCRDFTGSEIAALVPESLYLSFADGARELTAADLIQAAKGVVPLAKTMGDKLKTLRDWASGRARPASLITATTEAVSKSRAIDL